MDTRRISVRYPDRRYRQTNTVQSDDLYEFRISPSIPPDTRIHMRGGTAWSLPGGYGSGMQYESTTFDLSDSDTMDISIGFDNAYWYKDIIVALDAGHEDYTLVYRGSGARGNEYETAVEAEQAAILWLTDEYSSAPDFGPQLGILILRNNGIITADNEIMPIDAINRGRSYIWKQIRFFYQI